MINSPAPRIRSDSGLLLRSAVVAGRTQPCAEGPAEWWSPVCAQAGGIPQQTDDGLGASSWFERGEKSVHITQRTSPWSARIPAGTASSCRRRRARRSFCGDCKARELGRKLFAVALRALRFLASVNQRFEMVFAFLADVLEDGHGALPESMAAQNRISI